MAMLFLIAIAALTSFAMALIGLLNQQFVFTVIDVLLFIGCLGLFIRFLPRKE